MLKYALAALLASTSIGSAAPVKQETADRVRYSSDSEAPQSDGWLELADPTPASHGRTFVVLDDATSSLVRLRLAAQTGRPKIHSVRIDYADGTSRVVKIGKAIGKRPAYVDLRGARKVHCITIVSAGSAKATYTLHGEPPTRMAGR